MADAALTKQVKTYRDLVAWELAYSFGLDVIRSLHRLPPDERFGLATQMRRGSVSIASNIAEGYGRGGRADYIRFLKIARGALYELDTQLSFCHDLGYHDQELHDELHTKLGHCERVLAALIRALEQTGQTTVP